MILARSLFDSGIRVLASILVSSSPPSDSFIQTHAGMSRSLEHLYISIHWLQGKRLEAPGDSVWNVRVGSFSRCARVVRVPPPPLFLQQDSWHAQEYQLRRRGSHPARVAQWPPERLHKNPVGRDNCPKDPQRRSDGSHEDPKDNQR